jgi:hypothetical protein
MVARLKIGSAYGNRTRLSTDNGQRVSNFHSLSTREEGSSYRNLWLAAVFLNPQQYAHENEMQWTCLGRGSVVHGFDCGMLRFHAGLSRQ